MLYFLKNEMDSSHFDIVRLWYSVRATKDQYYVALVQDDEIDDLAKGEKDDAKGTGYYDEDDDSGDGGETEVSIGYEPEEEGEDDCEDEDGYSGINEDDSTDNKKERPSTGPDALRDKGKSKITSTKEHFHEDTNNKDQRPWQRVSFSQNVSGGLSSQSGAKLLSKEEEEAMDKEIAALLHQVEELRKMKEEGRSTIMHRKVQNSVWNKYVLPTRDDQATLQ